MKHLIVLSVFAIAMIAGAGSFANPPTGIPDMETSSAEMTCGAFECSPVLFNVPNGTGSSLVAAGDLLPGYVDATITLILKDGGGVPIVNFPAEDMWLISDAGFMTSCPNGTIADADTDVNGVTTWVNPLRAGGWSEGPTLVYIAGEPLLNSPLDLGHNSPDINGDGIVNLTDVALFAGDFYGDWFFRSDFHYDEVINLADVSKMAQAIGAACP